MMRLVSPVVDSADLQAMRRVASGLFAALPAPRSCLWLNTSNSNSAPVLEMREKGSRKHSSDAASIQGQDTIRL